MFGDCDSVEKVTFVISLVTLCVSETEVTYLKYTLFGAVFKMPTFVDLVSNEELN